MPASTVGAPPPAPAGVAAPAPAPSATSFAPAPPTSSDPGAAMRTAATTAATTRFRVDPADQPLVDAALAQLRRSPTGAPILARLEQSRIQMRVLDDASFDRLGKQGSAAFYDPKTDTITMRRSWLEKSAGKAASLLAHEGTHALDDLDGIGTAALQARTAALARGGAVTEETVKQAAFEVTIAEESRGYLVQGLVLRELGLADPADLGGPLLIAARGANDRATYDAVFRSIVSSPEGGYNPEGRSAEPFVI